jgi:hypothetical protein
MARVGINSEFIVAASKVLDALPGSWRGALADRDHALGVIVSWWLAGSGRAAGMRSKIPKARRCCQRCIACLILRACRPAHCVPALLLTTLAVRRG